VSEKWFTGVGEGVEEFAVSLALAVELVDAPLDGVGGVSLVVLVAIGVGGLPEAFVGGGVLLGLAALELLDERFDAHVVLLFLLVVHLFALLAAVLAVPMALALELCEKVVHGPLALDLLVLVGCPSGEGQIATRGHDPRGWVVVVVGKRRRSQRDEAGPSRGSAGACGGGHGGGDRRDAARPVKGERVFGGGRGRWAFLLAQSSRIISGPKDALFGLHGPIPRRGAVGRSLSDSSTHHGTTSTTQYIFFFWYKGEEQEEELDNLLG
jgi:hypothetical protein